MTCQVGDWVKYRGIGEYLFGVVKFRFEHPRYVMLELEDGEYLNESKVLERRPPGGQP